MSSIPVGALRSKVLHTFIEDNQSAKVAAQTTTKAVLNRIGQYFRGHKRFIRIVNSSKNSISDTETAPFPPHVPGFCLLLVKENSSISSRRYRSDNVVLDSYASIIKLSLQNFLLSACIHYMGEWPLHYSQSASWQPHQCLRLSI